MQIYLNSLFLKDFMTFISIEEALKKGKGKIAVRGWVYRERGSNEFKFIVLRDSTDLLQCVFKKENFDNKQWDALDKLSIESAIEVEGTLHPDKRAPTGYEVRASKFSVVHQAETYPITKDQSKEFLMDQRHLWIRSRKMTAIMKVRHTLMQAFREFFVKSGYVEWSAPVLTQNACEGGPTLFDVKYYKDKMYLTQSWQLYAEAAIFSLEKIFSIGPCFRAETSKTSRHLSEFWMAEMEAAWMDLDEMCMVAEQNVAYMVQQVVKNNAKELKILGQDIGKLKKIKAPFPRITYTEALDILNKKEKMKILWGKDLRTVEEDKLMKHFDTPIIVTNYPKEIMAFYKPKDPKNEKTALCFDMLAPEGYGELIGGSQRDADLEEIKKALKKEGQKPEDYAWYLDLRKYGSVVHSGYGLGIERVVAWVCGLDTIKDAIGFPRTMLRYRP
jgi:asparaginyl-tRNA synthetase